MDAPYWYFDADGDGYGAVLTPVLENNSILSITVIEKGSGYTPENTDIFSGVAMLILLLLLL